MRIGIMLRHMDQHGGGVMIYTRNLLPRLFALGEKHEFFLLYQNPKHIGTYESAGNVQEVLLPVPTRLLWDQLAVSYAASKYHLDIIFNPKYSLPLFGKTPGVFVCHGLDWYIMPWGVKWIDRISHRYIVPIYAHNAAGIIAVSDSTRNHAIRYWDVMPERVRPIYHGVSEHFLTPISAELMEKVRNLYKLPDRYLLYVGQVYPPKNFERIVRAYSKVGPSAGVHLVVAGGHVERSASSNMKLIKELGIAEWVVWPGWIQHVDLPVFYTLAEMLVMPSLYDAFLMPLVEAMAVGCPVVTANRYGTKDVVGEAGLLVNPESTDEILAAIKSILGQKSLKDSLVVRGQDRAKLFSWDHCAQETLDFLQQTHEGATA